MDEEGRASQCMDEDAEEDDISGYKMKPKKTCRDMMEMMGESGDDMEGSDDEGSMDEEGSEDDSEDDDDAIDCSTFKAPAACNKKSDGMCAWKGKTGAKACVAK